MRQHNIAFMCKTEEITDREFKLTFREKIAILFSRTLRIIAVPEDKWDSYIERMIGNG